MTIDIGDIQSDTLHRKRLVLLKVLSCFALKLIACERREVRLLSSNVASHPIVQCCVTSFPTADEDPSSLEKELRLFTATVYLVQDHEMCEKAC